MGHKTNQPNSDSSIAGLFLGHIFSRISLSTLHPHGFATSKVLTEKMKVVFHMTRRKHQFTSKNSFGNKQDCLSFLVNIRSFFVKIHSVGKLKSFYSSKINIYIKIYKHELAIALKDQAYFF